MSETVSTFAFSENLSSSVEVYVQKDVNFLRSFIRSGRLTETDGAILHAIELAHYANRANIEVYLERQKEFAVWDKKSYIHNLAKLLDNGFIARILLSSDTKLVPPVYTITPSCAMLLPTIFGKKRAYFSGIPVSPVQDILVCESAFQAYSSLISSESVIGRPELYPEVSGEMLAIKVALSANVNGYHTYWLVAKRSQVVMGRLRFDLNNLLLQVSKKKEPSAVVLLCEDLAHMEYVARAISTDVPAAAPLLLYTFDYAMFDFTGSLPLYRIDTDGASAVVSTAGLIPLR